MFVQNLTAQVIAKVQEDPTCNLRLSFDEVVDNVEPNDTDKIPSYDSIRHNIYRARNRVLPRIPDSIATVQIPGNFQVTQTGR